MTEATLRRKLRMAKRALEEISGGFRNGPLFPDDSARAYGMRLMAERTAISIDGGLRKWARARRSKPMTDEEVWRLVQP